ncbi:MAG: NADPH:quinone oxidoreductase family protein [Sphingomonadales bacterium]|nr:NADPH:quinone oxidoreductase family protein [Sphingomonadales bacterium]
MKALLSRAIGGPETLEMGELPTPVAGPGEVLIAVRACAINYPDVLIIEDKYQFKPPRPFAPGSEVAGTVAALGEGVTGFTVGQPVIAVTLHGGLAEQVVAPAAKVFPLADGVSFEAGASLLMTYATCLHALADRGRLQAGETVLVLGAAGGVGIAAVEVAKALGARVVAAVSSADKAEAARAAGADDVVVYGRDPLDKAASRALADAFKAACGPDGAHVVVDPVGGDYSEPALRAIAWGGRFLVLGFAAGIAKLPLNLPLLKACDIVGVFWGGFIEREPAHFAGQVAQLMAMAQDGRITPRIAEVFALPDAGKAIARLAARTAVGKLVVRVGD